MNEYTDITAARHLWGTVALVDFSDGVRAVVDFDRFMRGALYEELVRSGEFSQLTVDHDLGTIVWPNGLDVAPDVVREHAVISSDSPTVFPRSKSINIEVAQTESRCLGRLATTLEDAFSLSAQRIAHGRWEPNTVSRVLINNPSVENPDVRLAPLSPSLSGVGIVQVLRDVGPSHDMHWTVADDEEFRRAAL